MKGRAGSVLVGAAAIASCLVVGLWGSIGGWFPTGDYPGPPCDGCDSAGPPLAYLVHGHLSGFFSTQPPMGSVSLLLRAPAVAVVTWLKGDIVYQYRAGTLVLLLAAAMVLLPGFLLMLRRGQHRLIVLVLIAAIFAGPATFAALRWGHPEELFGAALAVSSVVAASHRRGITAGVLLGLAIATKQWGLFAILPVLMVARGQRLRVASTAAITAAAFIIPMLVGNPARFYDQNFNTAVAQLGVSATNLWWLFHQMGFDPIAHQRLEVLPAVLRELTHPLVLTLGFGLSLLYWRRKTGRHPYDALQLLSLLFLIRCVLDPLTIGYHHIPFVLTIAMFEGLRYRRLPIVTLTSTAALLFLVYTPGWLLNPDLLNAFYLLWAFSTIAYLATACFGKQGRLASSVQLPDQPARAQPLVAR